MRSPDEIAEIAESLKKAFLIEAGRELSYGEVASSLDGIKQALYQKFLFERISHLKMADLLNLLGALRIPVEKKEVIPISSSLETEVSNVQTQKRRGRPKKAL